MTDGREGRRRMGHSDMMSAWGSNNDPAVQIFTKYRRTKVLLGDNSCVVKNMTCPAPFFFGWEDRVFTRKFI